ncbi:hypothetical protein Desor_2095 [Desulfosporosinus orientis DSM 765]|uniref:SipW-cognate class signal peptide n=1 Tax=Desulfosporosinus orientis (strain ATCC 19365 / DSM 765 / NCIMB 8382 / VKM B-1628 / Singapore I) TaxID=768706 RepID=G7W641_DESOD|nr:hypothetical protein [Desulfosporosinus orientis]AET67703.1 hypothetical protein Desor_2095 [Desulfosporosinus orientis DSM 765]
MKKILMIIALALVLSTSVIAGTLAMYTTTIDNVAQGNVVAKEFVLLKGGTDTFTENVKIAPAETVDWKFSVKNYDGDIVSETGMDLNFDVDVMAENGKSVIAPLEVTVKNSDGDVVGSVTSSGKIQFNDEFALSTSGQEKVYTVSVKWPGNSDNDLLYAGADYGTAVKVSVTGTQK